MSDNEAEDADENLITDQGQPHPLQLRYPSKKFKYLYKREDHAVHHRKAPARVKGAFQRPARKSFVNWCLCFYNRTRNYKAACYCVASLLLIGGLVRLATNIVAISMEPLERDNAVTYALAAIDPFAALAAAESLESYDDRKWGADGIEEVVLFNAGNTVGLLTILIFKVILEIVPPILVIAAGITGHYRLLVGYMALTYLDLIYNLFLAIFVVLELIIFPSIHNDEFGKFAYKMGALISWTAVLFHIFSLHVTQGLRRQLREKQLLVAPKPDFGLIGLHSSPLLVTIENDQESITENVPPVQQDFVD